MTRLILVAAAVAGTPDVSQEQYLFKIEKEFQQNSFSASREHVGKSATFVVFLRDVENRNGSPVLVTSIAASDGSVVNAEIKLAAAATETALKLRSGDKIRVVAVLASRRIRSKNIVQNLGYDPSIDPSGPRTKTISVKEPWFIFESGNFKVMETKAARDKRAAERAATDRLSRSFWEQAVADSDIDMARKALSHGYKLLEGDLRRARSGITSSGSRGSEFYRFVCLSANKSFRTSLAFEILDTLGVRSTVMGFSRVANMSDPSAFKILVSANLVNIRMKFENGDNLLHLIIKDQPVRPATVATRSVSVLTERDEQLVRTILSSSEGKLLVDEQDKYGLSPRGYLTSSPQDKKSSTQVASRIAKLLNNL